jgi:capsular polysaccharide export protein
LFTRNGGIMIKEGLSAFSGKNVLLLQGPVGPFFWRLARDLTQAGANVTKVNFNGGDWLFYPTNAFNFQGRMEDWPSYLAELLAKQQIDVILLFGDCRPIHRLAHKIAHRRKLEIGVFEEGYFRPDFVTLERFGANNHSLIPRDADFYFNSTIQSNGPTRHIGNTYWFTAWWAILYYLAAGILRPFFFHYQHHRPLTWMECFPWIRSVWRKLYYKYKERGIITQLTHINANQFFLVPLQVHNDSQIHVHSRFESVSHFVHEIASSFAAHAPKNTILVIKHHPLDRGYHDYSRVIHKLTEWYNLQGRCFYIHDQHLPTLLRYARGVVVINSTVGLSALHHGAPTKVCGKAIFNIPGLTYQGTLNKFWHATDMDKPDSRLLARFQNFLIQNTQLNGSFYKRLPLVRSATGLKWASISKTPGSATPPLAQSLPRRKKGGKLTLAEKKIRKVINLPTIRNVKK